MKLTVEPTGPLQVVGIAASAGGLAALNRVIAPLPLSFAAAIIIVQHLAPDFISHLSEILQRYTALPVKPAEEGDQLRAGHIYVAQPNWHVAVAADFSLHLTQTARVNYSRPAADVLFVSLSTALGPRATAIVLTGRGRDGADGVSAVHACGGTVIVQESPEFTSMPSAALLTGCADYVLPLDEIPLLLPSLIGMKARVSYKNTMRAL